MGVNDWKLTLYPNEEEDEITRLRRDEQELNVAQRMAQLGFVLNCSMNPRIVTSVSSTKPEQPHLNNSRCHPE